MRLQDPNETFISEDGKCETPESRETTTTVPDPEAPPPAPPQETGAPDLPYSTDRIYHIPLLKIRVLPQVRSHVTITEASFLALKESIRERGILSPITVIREGKDAFLLVNGERRYWACETLGMQTIPARIIEGVEDPSDRIALQLIENMIREDLDPIDEARGYLTYLQGKLPGVPVSGLLNHLVDFSINPWRLPEATAVICRALERMAGKTINTVRSMITLLDLPEEIQQAVRSKRIGTGHGYLLAGHLDHPELLTIFRSLLKTPLSLDALRKKLEKGPQTPAETSRNEALRFRNYIKNIQVMKATIGSGGSIAAKDIDRMLAEVASLAALLQQMKGGGA